ncbi:MAG: phosphatidate cytidylyltransferase, partial [Pseudomonadota bacterium]
MPINLQFALWGVVVVLVAGTLIIWSKRVFRPSDSDHELGLRMRSWWVMAGLFILAIAVNRVLGVLFFGLVSFLALREYLSIIPTRAADKRMLLWVYLAI